MKPESTFLEYFLDKWKGATDAGDHQQALSYAIAAYFIGRDIERGLEGVFLLKIELSAVALQGRSTEEVSQRIRSSTSCSFCERTADEVQVMAGGGSKHMQKVFRPVQRAVSGEEF